MRETQDKDFTLNFMSTTTQQHEDDLILGTYSVRQNQTLMTLSKQELDYWTTHTQTYFLKWLKQKYKDFGYTLTKTEGSEEPEVHWSMKGKDDIFLESALIC